MIYPTEHQPTPGERFAMWKMRKSFYRHSEHSRKIHKRIGKRLGLQTRSGTGQASSDAADHSASKLGAAFKYLANLTGLAAWFGAIFAVTYIVGALLSVPEPETRTFTRADGTSYERTQQTWSVEDE